MSMYPPPPQGDPNQGPYAGDPGYGQPVPAAYPPPPAQQPPGQGQVPPQPGPYGAPYQGAPYQDAPYQQGQQPPYPGAPYQGQGGYPDPGTGYVDPNAPWGYLQPPPPKSRKGLKIGIGIGAAFILVVGGTIAYFVASEAATVGTYKLVPPATFQGYNRDDNSQVAQAMEKGAAKVPAALTPVVTVYDSGPTRPEFAFVGAYGELPGASLELSQFWAGATANNSATVQDKTDESAGPLGGAMQCAYLVNIADATKIPVCVWADNSTYAAVMNASTADSASGTPTTLDSMAASTLALRAVTEVKK
jgi:hypothetical protein